MVQWWQVIIYGVVSQKNARLILAVFVIIHVLSIMSANSIALIIKLCGSPLILNRDQVIVGKFSRLS